MESLIYFKYITNEPVARHSCAGGNLKFRVAAVIFVCTGTTDKPGPSEKYFSDGPARTNRSCRSPAVQPALPCSAQPCKPRYIRPLPRPARMPAVKLVSRKRFHSKKAV
ncbi:MAG: hypothetical protein D8H97_37495 [Neisseria sp.]|nr:MAG: hypothetical protein D8H97_37495 [Neisseria sp.]